MKRDEFQREMEKYGFAKTGFKKAVLKDLKAMDGCDEYDEAMSFPVPTGWRRVEKKDKRQSCASSRER